MEGQLKMKLTDYCILFGMILMILFLHNDLKMKAVNETQISEMLLNKNMDEIVVDGLSAGFEGEDANGHVKVNLEAASNRISEELSLLFYGKNDMKDLAWKYVKGLIYVAEDGYYVYDKGKWLDKVGFEEKLSHSERVELVSKIIEERTGEISLLSYNDGENYKNTIDDNTLIIVYCGYNFMTSEIVYKQSFISAACVKERE